MRKTFQRSTSGCVIQLLFAVALGCGAASPIEAQPPQISYFVSPSFPLLARAAMISGEVTLRVEIDKNGTVASFAVRSTTHVFLTQSATTAVKQWKFRPMLKEATVSATFYYAFSGAKRDIDATTNVSADFDDPIRVYITTEPSPTSHQ